MQDKIQKAFAMARHVHLSLRSETLSREIERILVQDDSHKTMTVRGLSEKIIEIYESNFYRTEDGKIYKRR